MEPLKKISLVALIPLVVSLIAVYNEMKLFLEEHFRFSFLKYIGTILRVMSQALGPDDSYFDQSAKSIQILLRSRDTLFIKLRLYQLLF